MIRLCYKEKGESMQTLTLIIAILSLALNVWCILNIKTLYEWREAAQELFMTIKEYIDKKG